MSGFWGISCGQTALLPFVAEWAFMYFPRYGSHTSNACLPKAGLLLCILSVIAISSKNYSSAKSEGLFFTTCCILPYRCPPLDVLLVSNFGGNFRDFLSDEFPATEQT